MKKFVRAILLLAFLASSIFSAAPAMAADLPPGCEYGPTLVGALTMYCVPPDPYWNGDLVVFAHGYTAFNAPLDFQNLDVTAPDGTQINLPTLVQSLGYAFATTSYRRNGLAILEGVEDMRQLTKAFHRVTGKTANRVFITGASEGGIVTALSVEQYPKDYAGGLSLCGPIGDFQSQINYWDDFRVLFDVTYPDALPPTAVSIPNYVIDNWETQYKLQIAGLLQANPLDAIQLLTVAHVPWDPARLESVGESTLGLLWYNVFATNDGQQRLKGQPYDNMDRVFPGPYNDLVQRYAADESAIAHMRHYNTTGQLSIPLVTMHTSGDPIVPYWHETLYAAKAAAAGSTAMLTEIPLPPRYGHCTFTQAEIGAAFTTLVAMANAQPAP